MILYNITVKIERDIQRDWLDWMKNEHIPKVLATGFFRENKILQLVEPVDADGFTYTIQYFCESREILQEYLRDHAPALKAEHSNRYKGKHVSFRTVLEVV